MRVTFYAGWVRSRSLLLAAVAVAALLGVARPAAADTSIDIPYTEVVESVGSCDYYRYFLQFSEVDGASSYSALNRYHGGGFTLSHSGPPFPDDDVQGEGYHWTAPPGTHRWGATAGSGPGQCPDQSLRDEWEPDYVRAHFVDFKVTGVVKKADGSPAAGVTITITGPGSDTVTTAADGTYTSKKFTQGGSYTVEAPAGVYCATGVDPCNNQRAVTLPPNAKVDFTRIPGAHPAYKWRGVSNSCLGIQSSCGDDANTVDIKFDASASTPDDGRTLVKYLWEFGDGQTGEGQKVSHLFASRQPYSVKLTTEDDAGRQESVTTIVDQCAGETTGGSAGGGLGRLSANGWLKPSVRRLQAGAEPFSCFSLYAGGSGYYADSSVTVPPPVAADDSSGAPPDTIENVVAGEELRVGGDGWEGPNLVNPVGGLNVQFRDIACEPEESTCDHAESLAPQAPLNAGPSVNWDATFELTRWPRHWPMEQKELACRGYLYADQALAEVPGFTIRRRLLLTGRPAGEVVYASGSDEWKTGDVYCEGENPMRDVGDGVVLITHPFDDPVPLRPINSTPFWELPPSGEPLFVWSDSAFISLVTAPVYLHPGAEMCVGVWSDETPYARNVVVRSDLDGSLTSRDVSSGSCPKLSNGAFATGTSDIARYGRQTTYSQNASEAYAQFKTKQCYGLITALTKGWSGGGSLPENVRVIPARETNDVHQEVTCSQRRNSQGVLVGQAQLADNRALFVEGGLHLRLAVFGNWMIVANGRLTLDQGVILGGSVKEGDWARSGLVATGAIKLGRGPIPRELTEEESEELLYLADLVDKQAELEGWAGFNLSIVDLASDLLPGFVRHSITALGLVLGYRGATAPAVARALRRAANNYKDEPPPKPVDPNIEARISGLSRAKIARLPSVRPSRGISRRTGRLLTQLRTIRLKTYAFAEAFSRALDRADAAAEKNKRRVARVRVLAATRHARRLARLLVRDVRLRQQVAASLRGRLRSLHFTGSDVRTIRRSIKKHGLPAPYLRMARKAGVDRGTLYLQRRRALAIGKRRATRSLRSILTDRRARRADLRAAAMFRLIAKRFAEHPGRPAL